MATRKPAPETIGSLFEFLFDTAALSLEKIAWPPDAFCLAASILQRSSAYTSLMSSTRPDLSLKDRAEDRTEGFTSLGREWRLRAAQNQLPPDKIKDWFNLIKQSKQLPLASIKNQPSLLAAVMNLMSAADQACDDLGLSLTASSPDAFNQNAALNFLPTEEGSTLCLQVHRSKARVLPKFHTPQSGLTIRSFSHFLALVSSPEVRMDWFPVALKTRADALNLLIIPWPSQLIPSQFRPSQIIQMREEVGFIGSGLFTFDALAKTDIRRLKSIVNQAEKNIGSVDGIVLPEVALTPAAMQKVSQALLREDRFLIAGVGSPPTRAVPGQNYIRFDVLLPGGQYFTGFTQKKHHRWKLDKNQIVQYGIGSILSPRANWWEDIDVSDRSLTLVSLRPWLTTSFLICEDLARPDPVGDVIRAVGPNLLVCLLMDGPQLASRWPGRYATSLADDPGSSVLTLTSVGMTKLSRAFSGQGAPPGCIALWKDARTGASEIYLPPDAEAMVLSISANRDWEWSADGKLRMAFYPYLVGQHPIRLDKSV